MSITEQILDYIKEKGPCDKTDIFNALDVHMNTLRPLLFRLVKEGNLKKKGNFYTFLKARNKVAGEDRLTKNEYYKELLNILLDDVIKVEDTDLKLKYVREAKQIIRELR